LKSFAILYVRVLRLLGDDARTAWLLIAGNIALVSAVFAEPVLFGRIIDVLTQSTDGDRASVWPRLWPLLLIWVGVGLFAIICSALIALFADRLSHRRRHGVLRDFFEHVLQLPAHHRDTRHSGRLMKIMLQGTDALWSLWLGFFRDHFSAFIAAVVLIPVAFYLNPTMASLLVLLCVFFVLLTRLVLSRTDHLQRAVEQHHSDLAEHVADTFGNVALVQSFARIQDEVGRLRVLSQRVVNAQFPALSWWALLTILARAATTFTVLAMLCLGLWLFIRNQISIGEIVTFIGFAGLIIGRLEQSVSFANRLALDAPKLREFFEVLDTVPSVYERADAIDPGRVQGSVSFQDVSFSYEGSEPAVQHFSLNVKPGQTVALVGHSGAGKSTALALLYRMFDPQVGSILIDGKDIREFTLAGLRRNVGIVFQETLLFNRSIAENLRVGDPGADEERLRHAAQKASALGFIERLPKGFESFAGERGRALSGGERQRLAIARVLLKDPPILILDEATSALDPHTEVAIQSAFEAVRHNRTTFVIAHRLSTIQHADLIVVMEHGRIVESGTFELLMQQKGRFSAMVQTQFQLAQRSGVHP
jgi:ATP-binding cassette, subfamily B, beta-glucan exporter